MIPIIQRRLTVALVTGCVCLLQWHSIHFWIEQGKLGVAGVAWSLLLEGCALWLWWQRRAGVRVLGVVASCLLLAGPVAQVAYPLMVSISASDSVKFQHSTTTEILKNEVSGLENSLAVYEQNSGVRLGWSERIDRTQAALEQARGQLLDVVATPVSAEFPALKLATIAGQVVALLLFQVTAVLGVLSLSRWSEVEAVAVSYAAPQAVAPVGPSHEVVAAALADYAEKKQLSGQPLADALGEPGATLWRVSKPGEKRLNPSTLQRVMDKLEAAA